MIESELSFYITPVLHDTGNLGLKATSNLPSLRLSVPKKNLGDQ